MNGASQVGPCKGADQLKKSRDENWRGARAAGCCHGGLGPWLHRFVSAGAEGLLLARANAGH